MNINQRFEDRFGVKVTHLSAKMGQRPDFVGGALRRQGGCRLDTLLRIQSALGCRLADLVSVAIPDWSDGPAPAGGS